MPPAGNKSDPNDIQNASDKLGPMTTPGGATGGGDSDASPQTITDVLQTIGPLPDGAYTIQGDVDMYVLSGNEAALAALTAADVIRLGVIVYKTQTEDFNADALTDNYVAWVRKGGVSGTDFRCNARSQGLLS